MYSIINIILYRILVGHENLWGMTAIEIVNNLYTGQYTQRSQQICSDVP